MIVDNYTELKKAAKVLHSCTNWEQEKAGWKYFELFLKKYSINSHMRDYYFKALGIEMRRLEQEGV